MVNLKKPWLNFSAKVAHDLSIPALKVLGAVAPPQTLSWSSFDWRGLHFCNRLGPSGGTDKNAELIKAWWALGAGFVEVGTITPEPQAANPGIILDRDSESLSVWNKMGFPNKGALYALRKLRQNPKPHLTPIFINIGKNRKTPNENASHDYKVLIDMFADTADVFVVNISSPNTKGLRELLEPTHLAEFLKPLIKVKKQPLLLKLSPDMDDAILKQTLDVSSGEGVDGWVLTNTTLAREPNSRFSSEGGVSGQPLANRSKEVLKIAVEHLGPRREDRLIVSSGGILTPEDVNERLRMGANLVQVYAALIFDGPFFFRKVGDYNA